MYYLILFVFSFILFNYNILSIWFSFFLDLSCYLSPFFWENQFFFSFYSYLFSWEDRVEDFSYSFIIENISFLSLVEYRSIFNKINYENNIHIYDAVFNLKKENAIYYLLWLEATTTRQHLIDFYCLQEKQIILSGETTLSFYRINNIYNGNILFYSVYIINPSILSLYLIKVQCFCFEEILIHENELINLPILIYLDDAILSENQLKWLNIIYLEYIALIKKYN